MKTTLLSDATLQEIDAELSSSSDCLVIDRDEFKAAAKDLYLYQGQVGTIFESASGEWFVVKVSIRSFVRESVCAAWDLDPDGFVKDARLLSGMLERAAKRVERGIVANAEKKAAIVDTPPPVDGSGDTGG